MSDMNLVEVTLREFLQEIVEDMENGNYGPIVGIGKAGVGKTYSIREYAMKNNIGYKELRLINETPVDMKGIPEILSRKTGEIGADGKEKEEKYTAFLPPDSLPRLTDGETGILVLDEITSAQPDVRAAAYQLLDVSRGIGQYKLPEKWKVVALGNGEDDGGVFNGMEAAFLSRAASFRINPDVDSWKRWALAHKVHPTVIAYIEFAKEAIHEMPPRDEAAAFPCPRSWTNLSDKLIEREARRNGLLDSATVRRTAGSLVGSRRGEEFATFYEFNNKLIQPGDILDGKVTKEQVMQLSQESMYITIQQLIRELGRVLNKPGAGLGDYEPERQKKILNAFNWALSLKEIRIDYAMVAIQDMTQAEGFTDVVLSSEFDDACPELVKFLTENSIALS